MRRVHARLHVSRVAHILAVDVDKVLDIVKPQLERLTGFDLWTVLIAIMIGMGLWYWLDAIHCTIEVNTGKP